MSCDIYYRVWADVDLGAIRSNIEKIRRDLSSHTGICAVIKADAYGHGAVETAKAVSDLTCFFAVATMEEAISLREAGIDKPILILGYTHTSYAFSAAEHDIRLTVFDYETAKVLSEAAVQTGKPIKVHIKIDTGMSRIGFAPNEESLEEIRRICLLPGIEAEGVFTHFARADEETPADARIQLAAFQDFIRTMEESGIHVPLKHCSNSAAATNMREADMDMVRLGISMYGLYPSEYVDRLSLSPALSLKSHVVMVKKIPAGRCVGYGGTWQAQTESLIATVPVGYADGYHRALSNKGTVLINGRRYPVAGRVCMDQIMIDVTESLGSQPVKAGDEVVLIGKSGTEFLSCEEVARAAGTINYEITCSLSPRVPRRYLQPEHF